MSIRSYLVKTVVTLGLWAPAARAGAAAWDGEESPARGKGWARPASCRVAPVGESPRGGSKCLRIDLAGDGWKGVGWNWFGWYPPDAATDARGAKELVFWLRASRPDAALQVRLADDRKRSSAPVDLKESRVLMALPDNWSEVRVPMARFGEGFDRSRLWEVHFGTASPGDLTLWVDDIGFDGGREEAPPGKPFAVRVNVEPDRRLHPISPYIYGVSAVGAEEARRFGVSAVRWGGNRSSRYNWRARADNAGADWFFLNGKAGRWSDFVAEDRKAGLASYLTVPMLPWVSQGT